ncbi:4,5-DOPA dioxygenase extradiol [Cladobotryum mycophilum]|uniref:4,5-DOPA dioxygenase extradiol n=1 Tax=Cladobotryum mycophilum TaxID=491253 RepID=A0ABR0SR15_9HYPO
MPVAPVIALSHGGGPMPILGDPGHKDIVYSLKNRVPKILKLGTPEQPRAIVLVTAHWTTGEPTISSEASHELLYDYYNFPPEAYKLKYPAPGEPELAQTVSAAFEEQGLKPVLDGKRGWDHGVFIPMLLVNPAADVPIVQVSVLESEDPEKHLRMGAALSKLRGQNIAIIGSGFASLHNFRAFREVRAGGPDQIQLWRDKVDEWNAALTGAVGAEVKEERWSKVRAWRELPHAYDMHPRGGGEHFMPLVVCAGAALDGEKVEKYRDEYAGTNILTYYWGAETVA